MGIEKVCRILLICEFLLTSGAIAPAEKSFISFIAPPTQIQSDPIFEEAEEVKKNPASTLPPLAPDALEVVMVSPEVDPFSKAGGMGDYLLGLSTALRNEGQKVTVISPLYLEGKKSKEQLIREYHIQFPFPFTMDVEVGNQMIPLWIGVAELKGVTHFFLVNESYFQKLYDDRKPRSDWATQSILLSRGALQLMQTLDMHPDIIHSNDWMAAPTPTFLKTDPRYSKDPRFDKTKTTHVIHNSGRGYQGEFWDVEHTWWQLNLHPYHKKGFLHPIGRGQSEINLTSRVLQHDADHVFTVSNGFRDETLTSEFAQGIEPYLKKRLQLNQYHGIVNGTDLSDWLNKLNKVGSKELAKADLIKEAKKKDARFSADETTPILGMVTRIVRQKGVDLVVQELEPILRQNPTLRFVFLGSGDSEEEKDMKTLQRQFPDRVSVTIDFNPKFSDQIYLGADLFLMPSRYEPCGIAQLNAMAVGTIPIVCATGGLKETVQQFNEATGEGCGVQFGFGSEGIRWGVDRGVQLYQDKILWGQLMANAKQAALNYTWENTARDYMRSWRWILEKDPVLDVDKIKQPAAALYKKPRRENLELDAWDRKNYQWDPQAHYWRSKVFPKLVLGTWEDILASQDGKELKNHVAIRMRAGWTLYVVDEPKWAIAYIEEAKQRGEVPLVGNDQIYLSKDSAHRTPSQFPDETKLANSNAEERLKLYQEYLTKTSRLNNKVNAVLAKDGTILHHFWVHGQNEEVERYAPLADGQALFYGVSQTGFFEMRRGAQRTGIIHVGAVDPKGGNSLGHIFGFLNRLQAEEMTPSTVILSNPGADRGVTPLERMRELARRIPEEVFPSHRLIRSLDQPASFGYWDFVFQRLFKRYPKEKVDVTLSYDQEKNGVFQEKIKMPGVLFKRENRYLVARYLAAIIYNRAVTEGAQRVSVLITAPDWLRAKIVQLVQEELKQYEPTFSDLGNFGKSISIAQGELAVPAQIKTASELKSSPIPSDKIFIGFHVSDSGINLVASKGGDVFFKKGNGTHKITPDMRGGAALQQQIVEVLKQFLAELLSENGISPNQIAAIGFSFPGPVHQGKAVRWVNFEEKWRQFLGKKEGDSLQQEYDAINRLKEIIPQKFGIAQILFLNSTAAHGLAEIKAHNGTMLKDAEVKEDRVRIVLKLGKGVGYAKIKNGALDLRPNEGGHLSVRVSNPHVCCDGCGVAGCLEQYVSIRGIQERGDLFDSDWAKDFDLKRTFAEASEIPRKLEALNELQKPPSEEFLLEELEKREVLPQKVEDTVDKHWVISYQVLNSLADIYADAIERFLVLTSAHQIILTGSMISQDKQEVLLRLIRDKFKAKYKDRYPQQADRQDFIIYGKADLVFGSAEGAALYAEQNIPSSSPETVQILESAI